MSHDGAAPATGKRILRWLAIHGAVAVVVFLLIRFYKCPIRLIFGVPCPGCGMTRACAALLRFDFKGAFRYHPLVYLTVPTVLYIAHQDVLRRRLPDKVETCLFFVMVGLLIAVYVARWVNGSIKTI